MSTFTPRIKDPECLKKFNMDMLQRAERSVYTIVRHKSIELCHVISKDPDDVRIVRLSGALKCSQDTLKKIRKELEERIDGLIDLQSLMGIPVSTAYIPKGRG